MLSYTPPEGWAFPTVEEIASHEKGAIRIGPFGSALKKNEYSESGIRVLGIEDVFPNKLVSDNPKYIPEIKYRELTQYTVKHGDILITNMGTVGRTCIVPENIENSIISSHLIKVSVDLCVAWPPYVSWMLNFCPLVTEQIELKSHGAIMAGFNTSLLKQLRIPLPPLAAQRRIAEILDRAEALRAKRRAALAQLDTLTQAIFLALFGDPTMNSRKWPMHPFGEICESRLGKMLDQKQQTGKNLRPYLRNANVQWFQFDLTNIFEMDFDASDREEFRLKEGDLLICEGGEPGRAAIWREQLSECYYQKALHRARPKKDLANPEYLAWLLFFLADMGGLGDHVTSATIAHLTGEKLKVMRIPLPPLPLQHEFARRVAAVEKLKAAHRASVAEMDALFTSLQHRAFRGEL